VIPVDSDLSKAALLSPNKLFADVSKCKIADLTTNSVGSLGFPRPRDLGVFVVLLHPIMMLIYLLVLLIVLGIAE
jgi:hypothetical protein